MSKEEPSPVNEKPLPTPAAIPAAAGGGSPADSGQPTTNPPPKPDGAASPLPPTTQQKQQPPEPELVTIPSYSRWFDWNSIHECEARLLPEFFVDTSSKNPTLYKYYRNSIIDRYRRAASATSSGGGGGGGGGKKIGFTEVRKTIVGDVGSIRRIFDFLESWGLINYSPSSSSSSAHPHPSNSSSAAKPTPPPPPSQQQQPSPADAAGVSAESGSSNAKKMCSGCKSLCSIACFACEKFGLVLCARCYVRGNYRVGLTSSDFKRVEISETAKTDWSDKETLHLLEGLMQYGDDWMRVAEHVGGSRTEKECIARFIKLPFGEQYAGGAEQAEGEEDANLPVANGRGDGGGDDTPPNPNVAAEPSAKRARLTPLADASNPIMAQAAFLSALASVEAAEAAASAAVTALLGNDSQRIGAANGQTSEFVVGGGGEVVAASGGALALPSQEDAKVGAESLLKEEEDTERIISNIAHVQMKEIQDKIVLYEAMDLKLEKEWQRLCQMKNQLFLDRLTLLFNKKHLVATSTKSSEIAAAEPDRTH